VSGTLWRATPPRGIAAWIASWTVLFAVVNRTPLLGGGAPIWDAKDSFLPFFVVVADHIRAGRIVAWDVWSNAGLPRLGDAEFGAVWPLQLLVGFLFGGTPSGFIAYWMILWWLGGAGMFLLARHLRAPGWAAFIVATGYAWSGIYTGHAEHISWLVGFSSLPYVIWRLDCALVTGSWLPAVQSGAIWGAAATAAYPGVTIITAMLMFVWTCARTITAADRKSLRNLLALSVAGLIGVLCLSPTYVSFFYESAGVHVRRDPLPRDEAVDNNALASGALVTSVSPHFASLKFHTTSPPLWRQTDVSSVSVYTGAVTLAMAVAALVLLPRNGWRWFLAALALLWIGIAVGSVLPLRGWLYDWVYPTRFFRHSALFRLYFIFGVAVLALTGAAEALSALTRSANVRRRFAALCIVAAGAACLVYWFALPAGASNLPDATLGRWHMVVVWGGLASAGALVLVAPGRISLLPWMLVGLACADAFLAASLTRHTMFSSAPGDVAWWRQEAQLHDPDIDLTRRGLMRTLQACEINPPCSEPNTWGMITKVPALSTYTASTNPFYELTVADPLLAQSAIGQQRIWFSPRVVRAGLDMAAFGRFLDRARALDGIPLVVHDEQSMLGASPQGSDGTWDELPRAMPLSPTVERYTADELRFRIEVAAAGWILITDRWARSWRATVDGRRVPLLGGNFVFRAVAVPAGRHRIDLRYEPLALPWLAVTSWMTMLAVAIASIGTALRTRTRA
jgi:hypothetical protein